MVTGSAAMVWNLNSGEIQPDKNADLVVTKKKNGIPTWDDVFKTNPEDILLIVHKGNIKMFDKAMHVQLVNLPLNNQRFSRVSIKGHVKFIEGDLPALITNIKTFNPHVQFTVEITEAMNTPACL
jgi:hypothetical protein